MSETKLPAFRCEKCESKFPWKPLYAGRRVKCRCGHVSVAPAAPESPGAPAAVSAEDDLYDLAPEPVAAPPASRPAGRAAPETSPLPATPAPAARPAASASPEELLARVGLAPQRVSHLTEEMLNEDRQATERLLAPSPLRDIVVPSVLIVAGLWLGLHELSHARDNMIQTYAAVLPQLLMRSLLGAGLMLGAALLAAVMLDVSFIGSWRKSIFKLCCIAIAPAAVHGLAVQQFGDMGGSLAGVLASVGIYALLVWYLLRLSLRDTALLVLLAWILLGTANYIAFQIEGARTGAWI